MKHFYGTLRFFIQYGQQDNIRCASQCPGAFANGIGRQFRCISFCFAAWIAYAYHVFGMTGIYGGIFMNAEKTSRRGNNVPEFV
ncbi:MAG: hypothetical protein LMBGKNDO_00369 [Bacteroidales bacterium]|nr:hypothetical protein [Bacteroidales bacterium]